MDSSTEDFDKPRDFPFDAMVAQAKELVALGIDVWQKFTCVGCGNRLTIPEPNVFYTEADCDNCSALTDIKAQGCNYMVRMTVNVGNSKPEDRDGAAEGNGHDHNPDQRPGESDAG